MTSRLSIPVVVLAAAAVVVTLIEGVPARMPGVALGSEVLLHAERATALFALIVAVLTVLAQAARGRLPVALSTGGLTYESEAAAEAGRAIAELQSQVDRIETTLTALSEHVDAPPDRS